ncbi:DUF1838 family protein [Novosphingobium sp. Gsoil 351]|uniref:DUF1838 family protein n=1 Tax=Novosphingobium sp. Gsoil 351 TaxID=2675225 RepID=UPI0018A80790|nr:DUF1838 family protein [Novosphingobium sp. Gsoil 351]
MNATPAIARKLDPAVPADALELNKRVGCGEADGKPAVYYWSGKIYSRVDGEPDKLLFNGEGMNVRQCVAVTDPQRGKGYRHVSREVMFFTDPVTGKIIREWKNPWTGETVPVMHINNDPVNARPSFPISADGKPATISLQTVGDYTQLRSEAPLFYKNPLAGEYQDFVGGSYHAMEIFDFTMPTNELFDTRFATVYPSVAWVRISRWMPWMKMGDRQGQIVFNAMGAKLKSYDLLPAVIKDEIAANYPIYTAPPPGDDPRPNATTWTVFKAQVDAARAKADGK